MTNRKAPPDKPSRGEAFLPRLVEASTPTDPGCTQTFRCRTSIARTISEIWSEAQTGVYPWKTRGDVLRWCIEAGLEQILKAKDEDGPFKARQNLERAAANLIATERDTRAIYTNICQAVRSLLLIDERARAVTTLHEAVSNASDLDDGVWGNWLVRELYRTFPDLVGAPSPAVSMEPPPVMHALRPEVRQRYAREIDLSQFDDPPGVETSVAARKRKRKGTR